MTDNQDMFKVQLETGEVKDAELLNVVEIEGQEYAIYSIDNEDGTVSVMASVLIQDEHGNITLADLEDPEVKALIAEYIKQLTED